MRDCVRQILDFNKGFDVPSLSLKLKLMSESAFSFFRATFHLFAADLQSGPFHKLPTASSQGRMVADLHTENFGGFRTVSGALVYDINDFDDTSIGPYEYDLRRMLTSLILGGTENGHRLGQTISACEGAVHSYIRAIAGFKGARKREDLAALHDPAIVRRLLKVAAEQSHVEFIRARVEPRPSGGHQFISGAKGLAPVSGKIRQEAEKRFKSYLGHCQAPDGIDLGQCALQDVVFRFAGKGSLGKNRYALLVREGPSGDGDDEHLRIIEWKESTDSPLAAPQASRRKQAKYRNREVSDSTVAFQLHPRRYLGYVWMFGTPMQAREIGANDCRFDHSQYAAPEKLEQAAEVFGGITARCHLLASLGETGPRTIVKDSGVTEDRFTGRLVSFATSYANRVHEDFLEFHKRRAELAKAWKKRP